MSRKAKGAFTLGAVLVVGIGGCGSTALSLNTNEATAQFRKETASHYHGTIAANDNEGQAERGEPVVPTEDGRGCHPTAIAQHWDCTAYVYMNSPSGPNYDVSGTVIVTSGGVTVEAHGKPQG